MRWSWKAMVSKYVKLRPDFIQTSGFDFPVRICSALARDSALTEVASV